MQQLPILLHENTAAYKDTLRGFMSLVVPAIKDIRESYAKLKLNEPFSNEVWRDLVEGGFMLERKYETKVQEVRDLIGITAGITAPGVLNKSSAFDEINARVEKLKNDLNAGAMSVLHLVDLSEIVNVATEPELSKDGKAKLLENFREYLTTPDESRIKNEIEAFANAYNKLAGSLATYSFWNGIVHPVFFNSRFDLIISEEKESGKPSQLAFKPQAIKELRNLKSLYK